MSDPLEPRQDGTRIDAAIAFARTLHEWYDQSTQELSRENRGVPKGANPLVHWGFCLVGLMLPLFLCGMVFVLGTIGLSKTLETFEKVGYFFGLWFPVTLTAVFAFAMSYFRAKLHTYEWSLWRGVRSGFWICMVVVNTMILTTLIGFMA